jgi:hypothetical protein
MRHVRAVLFSFLGALLLSGAPAMAQRGAMVAPANIADLVQQASTIVRGHVISARVAPLPDLPNIHTVVVIFRVDETLKGSAEKTVEYRQFIWDIRDRMDAAGYRKGQHLLLMLNPPTSLGLRSTAGIEMGRFRILPDASGTEYAINGHGNYGLLDRIQESAQAKGVQLSSRVVAMSRQHKHGAIALADLKQLIKQFAEAK